MKNRNGLASQDNSKGDVYVVGPAFYGSTASVFRENGYRIVDTMDTADIIVLTGGADIDPRKFYGEQPIPGTHFSEARDRVDMYAAQTGIGADKFMVGICRGAQLLNCWPNGGTLWQDVDSHAGSLHIVRDHITGDTWTTNSVHHQMMRINKQGNGVLVASTRRSQHRQAYKDHENGLGMDPEVVWYPDTKCLLFQGHPEFGHPETTKYFFTLMDRYYHGQKPNRVAVQENISHDHDEKYDPTEEGTPRELLADCGIS